MFSKVHNQSCVEIAVTFNGNSYLIFKELLARGFNTIRQDLALALSVQDRHNQQISSDLKVLQKQNRETQDIVLEGGAKIYSRFTCYSSTLVIK